MKLAAVIALMFAFLIVGAGTAEAQWYLPISLAKHETKLLAQEDCEEDVECIGWGWGPCSRRSVSRVDCWESTFFLEEEGEMKCDIKLHWGVDFRGVIALKGHGSAYCYFV